MSATYRIHGLTVRSDIALSAIEVADGDPDVRIRRADDQPIGGEAPDGELIAREIVPPDHAFYVTDTGGDFTVRYGHTCDFSVARDGRKIAVTVARGADLDLVSIILSAGGMAFAAMRNGCHVLHASGATIRDRAVIAIGDPGAGKTTTAAELALAGGSMLADDAIRVDLSNGAGARVYQGAHTLRLREPAARVLSSALEAVTPASRSPDGRVTFSPSREALESVPLLAVLVPVSGPQHHELSINRLASRQAVIETTRHIRIAGFLKGTHLVDHFAFSSELAQRVPFFELRRPVHPLPPDQVRAMVEDALPR